MPTFIYRAKKGPHEILEGRIEADSENTAIHKLMDTGYFPVSIKEESSLSKENLTSAPFFGKKVQTKDIANFTRQLSELLDSGLALYNSLTLIENQTTYPHLKNIIKDIRNSVKDGKAFSESLRPYPHIFSSLYVNLVRSGEAGGVINEVLNNIADFLEKQEDIRAKILAALAYPMLMAAVGLITIFILTAFVIPRLANMFIEMDQILPLPTRILIGLSNFSRDYWILFLIFTIGLVIFFKKGSSNIVTKRAIDKFKLKLPLVGRLIKNTELARFSGTLSTLLKNGVPILDALKITSDIIDNEIVKEEIDLVYLDVKAGSSLNSAIKKNSSFPQFIVDMTAIGEEGGSLDKVLLKAGKNYEIESDRTVKILSSLLEPVVILVMGIIVGFIVISMLLPVFQISLSAQ